MADMMHATDGKTVIIDNEERSRNYGPNWSAEPTFGQTAIAKHVGDIGAHLLNALHTQFGHITRGQGDIRSDVRDVGHGVSRDVSGGQRDILGAVGNARDAVREESGKLAKDICDTRDTVRQDGGNTRERVQTEGRFNAEAFSTIRREIAGTESVLRKDLCDVRDAVRTEGCETREVVKDRTDQLAREMFKEFALTRENDIRNFADMRLQASENTARLSRELAECCCEVKELVRGEGASTRELFNATETARLRDALASAENKLTLLDLKVKL